MATLMDSRTGWWKMKRTSILSFYGLLLVLVSFQGCAPEVSCESGWCGTVVVSSAPARSLFPPLPVWDVDFGVYDLIFSKLADVGSGYNTVGDDGFVPVLASEWAFEDDLTISFTLNPNARWHDGVPVSAEDVVFTFDLYLDPEVASPASSRLNTIESVSARDSSTVVFRFRYHYPEQFYDAVSHVHILPNHLLGSAPRSELRSHEYTLHPIGSGPYRLVNWTPGETVELAADSTHFLGRPGAPRIIWRAVGGSSAAIDEMISDRSDFLYYVAEPTDLDRISAEDHLRLIEYESNTYNFVTLNLFDPNDPSRPHLLFGDRELRRAIVRSVDRAAIIQSVLNNHGLPCVGPVTPALWIWNEDLEDGLPFDTVAARSAFTTMGWTDSDGDGVMDRNGVPLEFDLLVGPSQIRSRGALVLQAQFDRVGIKMNLLDVDGAAFYSRQESGEFDAAYNSVAQDASTASLASDWTEDGFGDLNLGKYSNPEYTRLAREARLETDPDVALPKWHAALRIINEDAPAIWIYVPKKYAAVHARLEGVTIFPYQPWRGLAELRVAPSRLIERDQFGFN